MGTATLAGKIRSRANKELKLVETVETVSQRYSSQEWMISCRMTATVATLWQRGISLEEFFELDFDPMPLLQGSDLYDAMRMRKKNPNGVITSPPRIAQNLMHVLTPEQKEKLFRVVYRPES